MFGQRRTLAEPTGLPAFRVVPERAPEPEPEPPPPPPRAPVSGPLVELRAQCLARVDPTAAAAMTPERLVREVERLLGEIATESRLQLNSREQHDMAEELVHDMVGLGPLEQILDDDGITDIMVNGPDKVFIEKKGKLILSEVRFRDAAHVANICQRIAASVGRRVDESSPIVDARLKDGSRVNIVLQPLALDGPYVSIRKFAKKKIDFKTLVAYGSMTESLANLLQIAGKARLNVVVSGGTGSGKTTMLNALSRMIDVGERIVTVEDAAELQLQQPHVVRLETRPASLEGRGEITQRDLVKNALRMRPDRIIIGEVRGPEAFDMLQAMNTGHDGSMGTVHANTTRDALTRIENMVQMGSMGLPVRAIRTQIVSAINLVLQVERHRDGGRRLSQITEICGLEGDVVTMNDVAQLELTGEGADGRLKGHYKISRARPAFFERLVYFGLDRAWLQGLEDAASEV